MNKKPDSQPELKILENESAEEATQSTQGDYQQLENTEVDGDSVKVLHPDKEARFNAKTFVPDVAAILDTEEESVDTEEDWGGSAFKAPPLGWFVVAGLVITGLSFWATLSVFKAQPKLEEVASEKDDLEELQVKETEEVKQTLEAMEMTIRGYLSARSLDELLPFVRHEQRVKPLMQHYYASRALEPKKYDHLIRTRSLGLENESFVSVTVQLAEGGSKILVLQQIGKRKFAVDWETDVCYQPVSWEKFLDSRSSSPTVMRALIRPDDYYSFEFRDEENFRCYRIEAPDSDAHVYGFVKKGTLVAEQLRNYTIQNGLTLYSENPQPIMLRLSFPENTRSRSCVWIHELVEPRWLFIDSPEEG